mgnify:CR=1 FL=1
MKKQMNPTIKAYLIRGAFYLLLLLAVCAIPFALAQSRSRGTTEPSCDQTNGPPKFDLAKTRPFPRPMPFPPTRTLPLLG